MQRNDYIDYEIITRKDESETLQIGILKDNIPEIVSALYWEREGKSLLISSQDSLDAYLDFPEFMLEQIEMNRSLYLLDLDREKVHEILPR